MLNVLLSNSKDDLIQNGRVSLDKLYEVMKGQEGGYALGYSDFQSIFGTQKTMKVSDLAALLKKNDLNSFDIKNEISNLFFEQKKFSFDKLSKTMKSMGFQQLNKKNREMANECFDFNSNNAIDQEDIEYLLEMITSFNLEKQNNKDIRESFRSKRSH